MPGSNVGMGKGSSAQNLNRATEAPARQETDALHSLYRQAVHLAEEKPPYNGPSKPITRMTHNDLQAMKAGTIVEQEVKAPFKVTVANFAIRFWDELMLSFKPGGDNRRLKCLDVGHECIHCGKQFAIEQAKDKKS